MSTTHKLFEYNILWDCLKFRDKMDLSIQMRMFINSKHRDTICLKFGDLLFTTLTKLVLKTKGNIYSTFILS